LTNFRSAAALSSGEIQLSEHSEEWVKGGAEVRLVNIEADPGAGHGIYENLHGRASGVVLSDELKRAALAYYGTAFREFIRVLCGMEPEMRLELIEGYQREFMLDRFSNGAPEVSRVAARMALLAAAGGNAV
jgi:putative DNA primase/helicase